jgi:flagellar biosynthesis protein FlhF
MKLKSYFSGSVEAATELARTELGEEALLVNARPATPEAKHLGAYEVVFGVPPREVAIAPSPAASAAPDRAAPDRLTQDITDLKREIERLMQCLRGGRAFAPAPPEPSADELELYPKLLAAELDPMLAQAVVQGKPFEELFEVDATLGLTGAELGVVALIGPPGVGKTTALVKLAANYGLPSRRPAHILSVDVYRVAAADQLRSLASILGIGCEVVETPAALAQALEGLRNKDLVLIDTPGLAANEMEDGAELAALLASHAEIDTHLVLSASMKPADMARVIERYEIFRPKKLLFTRLDETSRYGALVSEAARRSLPISFLTCGQQIPEDIEPASKARLKELILGAEPMVELALGSAGGAA